MGIIWILINVELKKQIVVTEKTVFNKNKFH